MNGQKCHFSRTDPFKILKFKAELLSIVAILLAGMLEAQTNEFTWTTNADNTLTLTHCSNPGVNVSIPASINGLTVTVIGYALFAGYTKITNVAIPDTITSIGKYTFLMLVLTFPLSKFHQA